MTARSLVAVAVMGIGCGGPARREAPADLIVNGGPIYTASAPARVAEAFAVRDTRFIAVGRRDEVLAHRGPDTVMIDLAGATVVPGFQDAHGHVLGLGTSLSTLDLRGTATPEIVAARVLERRRQLAPGAWIVGRGWDQNVWPAPEWPTRGVLDRAVGDAPVYLERIDGHAAWVNSAALAAAGIDASTPDPEGGRLLRDAAGAPTGVLIDTAQALVERHIPAPDAAEVERRILAADREMARQGITSVHDAGASTATIDAYLRLSRDGRLATRLYVMIDSSPATTAHWFARGPLVDGEHKVTVRAIKLYADGALGSRGARLLEDYADEPGSRGLWVTSPEQLAETARAAVASGFQPCTHAIGDAANRAVLDMYERLAREGRALRPRIEHAQILDAEDIPRFGRLGVVASMQPTHCTSDMPWAGARLGSARVDEGAYVWQKLRRAGARLASGSDFPVEEVSPLLGFYAAVTRQSTGGLPPEGWAPGERLTRDEALSSFTVDAAWAAHADRDLGPIAVGMLADFVVLSRDIMTVAASEIPTTEVRRTFIGGRQVPAGR